MERRELNVFADEKLDLNLKLAFARDLQRMYASLVAEPVPPHLQSFVERLCRALERGGASPHSH
jgi:hypothetical protein